MIMQLWGSPVPETLPATAPVASTPVSAGSAATQAPMTKEQLIKAINKLQANRSAT